MWTIKGLVRWFLVHFEMHGARKFWPVLMYYAHYHTRYVLKKQHKKRENEDNDDDDESDDDSDSEIDVLVN